MDIKDFKLGYKYLAAFPPFIVGQKAFREYVYVEEDYDRVVDALKYNRVRESPILSAKITDK